MRRLRGCEAKVGLPMGPMIDMVFLLLIYFVLTFVQQLPEGVFTTNTPSPIPGPVAPQSLLELKVLPGQLCLQGTPRATEDIREALVYIGRLEPETTVIVKASRLARSEEVIKALDLCQGAKLTKLNLVALR